MGYIERFVHHLIIRILKHFYIFIQQMWKTQIFLMPSQQLIMRMIIYNFRMNSVSYFIDHWVLTVRAILFWKNIFSRPVNILINYI
jgi:hypothetical protein